MSTFNGQISEIPGISVDRFCDNNLKSKVLFLSHCHADHMVGLTEIADNIESFTGVLYASPVSVLFLKQQHPSLKPFLKELNIGRSTFIQIPEISEGHLAGKTLTVTPLPAGHCPGSVMFIFEIDNIKILYTGDFRLSNSAVKKMKALHNSNGEPKSFTNIYLDTTFMLRRYPHFPSQKESFEELFRLTKEWISLNKRHIILLQLPARYGSEYIYIELAKRFNMPIHVTKEAYDKYICIPNMDNSVTMDSSITQIHACIGNNKSTSIHCRHIEKEYIRIIRPSALIWTNMDKNTDLSKYDKQLNIFRVCYSSHASFNELKYFIEYFRQKKVTACVLPDNLQNKINKHIYDLCSQFDAVEKYIEEDYNLNLSLFQPDLSEDIKQIQNIMKRARKTIQIDKEEVSTMCTYKKYKDEFTELSD